MKGKNFPNCHLPQRRNLYNPSLADDGAILKSDLGQQGGRGVSYSQITNEVLVIWSLCSRFSDIKPLIDLNRQSLNSRFLFLGREKMSKNP
ncbi:hypothetical protein MTR_1g051620 [Medicago truncatula]|uniref:Uncharacterized protein n=1 Tax=Medicago truncatula TaxID=3880 RepID=A0A072VJ97_MEDTR|nr:hypothetical protein MTR_1g051620 [Medicago truncatula]